MNELRKKWNRFLYNNSGKGIPNLMLFISIGTLIVYFFTIIDPSNVLYRFLCFDRTAILHGQVWRLITYIFIPTSQGIWLFLLLFAYYGIGRMVENVWGTLKFNLFYLCGVVIMDIAGLILNQTATTYYLNLSLFLAVATIAPEARVLLFFILPIKMKYMAWVYLGFTALNVFSYLRMASVLSFYWLLPVVPLLNYFLFFGSDIKNILPDALRYRQRKNYRTTTTNARPNPNWAGSYRSKSGEKPYRHKCTVCGRTDTDYPNLEFRYCSKCNGYYCYCIDHINNHVHITTPPQSAEKK